MSTCYNCGGINTTAPIKTPDGDKFMLVTIPANGTFNLPPNGIVVNAFGCNKCGVITLGSPELINKNAK